ncbi:TPA: hypothetical protein ACP2I1_002933, partial [Listeria monocytogenes]
EEETRYPKKNILSKGCLYFYYYIEETLFL